MVQPVLRFAPLQPSNLRFLSGPSSPTSPISPIASRARFFSPQANQPRSPSSNTSSGDMTMIDRPSMEPMPWLWCCHVCSSHFPLGATRRCLNDGHHFCGGTTYNRRTGRVRRHKSCQSEFDYRSWGQWGHWRRDQSDDPPASSSRKDCGKHCDFPSECRFTKRRAVRSLGLEPSRTRSKGYASSETLAAVAAISPSEESIATSPVTAAAATPTLDPATSLVPTALNTSAPSPSPPTRPTLKRSGYTVERLVKAAEKKPLAPISSSLSPIEEEHSARSSPTSASIVGLSLPTLEFSNFPTSLKNFQYPSFLEEEHGPTNPTKAPNAPDQKLLDLDYDADIEPDASPRSPELESESPVSPLTPSPQETVMDIPSILRLQKYLDLHRRAERSDRLGEVSAISSRRKALSDGSVGGALTPPSTPKAARRNIGHEGVDEMET